MDFIAIIPSRAGSKGIKNKNTTVIKNKKLIEYTFEVVQKSKLIKKVFLTSDDHRSIKSAAKYKKIKILFRKKELSKSNSLISEVVNDVLIKLKNETSKQTNFILLQPTSPQRTLKDVEDAIKIFKKNKGKNLISISEPINHPYEMLKLSNNKYSLLIKRKKQMNRQSYEKFYFINGSIFIGSIQKFLKTKKFIDNQTIYFKMDKKHSIDINDEIDKILVNNFL